MRDPATKIAMPDPERAPLVLEMFERYATGQESDRTLAAWLNAKGARTARGRPFGKDTVREMLCNAAYAGYVAGLRDKSRSDQRPARGDRQRGAVRPRAGSPLLAHASRQARPAL